MPLGLSDYLHGQQKVRIYGIVLVLFDAVLLCDLWAAGSPRALTSTGRLVLTALLMFWMARGSNVARWIVVVLIGIGTAAGAILLAEKQILIPELVTQLIAQGYIVWKLVRDSQVQAFFRGLPGEPVQDADFE